MSGMRNDLNQMPSDDELRTARVDVLILVLMLPSNGGMAFHRSFCNFLMRT